MSTPPPGTTACYRHPDREGNIRCQRCERPICPSCMREASVGFQCPTCVAEGARSVRQPTAAYGGRRSANPMLTTLVLVGINVATWLAVVATGWRDSALIPRLALVRSGLCESIGTPGAFYRATEQVCATIPDGRFVPGMEQGAYWQLLTSAFMHVEIWHIAVNMLSLVALGPQLEAILGRARFLVVYLVSGLAGSVVVYLLADAGFTVGASGAIFGLLGALVVIIHKAGGSLNQIGGLLLLNAVITFTVPNVSWQGHLGGFLGGLVTAAILAYAPRGPRRTAVQAAGVAGVLLVLGLLVALRTVTLA
ncbi:rhomboid family intramembrane serine protease [Nocardioides sp.]|uniref:rhomboid family intramembrane serine protease n=1 Tax=Nocardioides sp. TaxID=35761 RepID=UPI003514D542